MTYYPKLKYFSTPLFLTLVLLMFFSNAKAQSVSDTSFKADSALMAVKVRPKYIIFSGLVVTSDSLRGIPWVLVRSKQRGRLGYSDEWGHFTVIVRQGDSILFEQTNKESELHVIPDTLTDPKYQVVKVMVEDTFSSPTIYIHAMPPKSLFDAIFLASDPPDDAYERARKNLEAEELKEQMKLKPADATSSYKQLFQERSSALYYYKQVPPQNWLSPVAWSKFLSEWKAGKYKKKKK